MLYERRVVSSLIFKERSKLLILILIWPYKGKYIPITERKMTNFMVQTHHLWMNALRIRVEVPFSLEEWALIPTPTPFTVIMFNRFLPHKKRWSHWKNQCLPISSLLFLPHASASYMSSLNDNAQIECPQPLKPREKN
jgi:hypothetical protein